jgi:2'-5' RNA ligase
LHFLGSLEDAQIEKLVDEAPKIISKYNAIKMTLGEIGCFPDPRQPRVIFVEAKESGEVVRKIHGKLKTVLQNLGLETDTRPWQSHITLGRVKISFACQGLDHPIPPLKFKVDSIDLMESKLLARGPKYTIFKNFRLT